MILNLIPNLEKYIVVSYEESYMLQLLGYIPCSRDNDGVYFKKTDNIENILKEMRVQPPIG